MQALIDEAAQLYTAWKGTPPINTDLLPQSGSDRRYLRLHGEADLTVIATCGANVPENDAFVYFAEHFSEKGLPVPAVLAINEDRTIYLQEDLGDVSLLNILEAEGFSDRVKGLFAKSLSELTRLQVQGHAGLDYTRCITNQEFGRQAIKADLFYFKYYFLDALQKPYDKQKLGDDFDALSNYLTHTEYKFFMFRDFQSRNIQVQDDRVAFIDFQGGMKGAPQYDVASMLWQARASLPDDWKESLLEGYMDAFEGETGQPLDRAVFRSQYNGYVLIRLLQVLGAYGFRGLFERKAQFLTAIPQALKNLQDFSENNSLGLVLPELQRVLRICASEEIVQRFSPVQATEDTPLVVRISSFSYKNGGIPPDDSGNGGGFVFDCRGILNPGRVEEYKYIHGRDKPVMDYLERQTRMQEFLNAVYDIVDISVEDYIKRGFADLSVNFGCTGGQHRSVYAADALARHLKNKYGVKMEVSHRVQEAKDWKNEVLSA